MIPQPETQDLLVEQDGNVLTITLNRPDRLNAISTPMLRALSTTLQAANLDRDVRAVILTGAGRGFCSGLDLKAQGSDGGGDGSVNLTGPRSYQLFDLHNSPPVVINRMDKPIVCALNGDAAGMGASIALCCDIIVANETARFSDPHIKNLAVVAGDAKAPSLQDHVTLHKVVDGIYRSAADGRDVTISLS